MELEVLAPAGSPKALEAAFAGGADAVYLALPRFGARAYAVNFSMEEVGQSIEQAHLAGKKIFVTMNTLIEEDQMEAAYEQAKQLHELGVDALIIQDLGLIHLLHHRLPELELHASTQLSVSTPYQIEQLRKLGVKRCVLAREATLDEIRACAKTGMELEVFIHGALCISYSGQCRFSQVRYDRSANKGACAQACRMEYTLEENGQPVETQGRFLLSPKDLSVIDQIRELKDAGVFSLKIEGRMKSPEYVYESARAARAAADGRKVSQTMHEGMETAFNRGYSKGHAYKAAGKALMNTQTSNHQGVHLGEVLSVSRDKARIRLDGPLHQNDGIRFASGNPRNATGQIANFIFDKRGKLVSSAQAGEIIEVKTTSPVRAHMEVRKTSSFLMQKETEDAIRTIRPQSDITFTLHADSIGSPLCLVAYDGIHQIEVQGAELQAAQKAATSRDQIVKSLEKTKDTWAHVKEICIDLPDNAFVPASILNTMRREAIEQLTEVRKQRNPIVEVPYEVELKQPETFPSFVEIMNKAQKGEDALMSVSEFPMEGTEYKSPIYKDDALITDSLGKGKVVDNLNITNSYALAALLELGYAAGTAAGELSDKGRADLMEEFRKRYGFDAPLVLTVYEKPRLMIMKHCPVNTALKDGKRQHCALCRTNRYTLKGKDGHRAIMMGNPDCRMQLFDEKAIDRIDEIEQFKEEGIHIFRMVLCDETKEQSDTLRRRMEKEILS